MRKTQPSVLLIVGVAIGLLHFGTLAWGNASEVAKSVENTDPVAQTPPAGKLPAPLLALANNTGAFSQYAFLVDKKQRTLTVWQYHDNMIKLVSSWPTDIGQNDGDKRVEGDKRTPEGVYFFQTQMDGRKVSYDEYGVRIFTLDYPNYFDRLEKKTGNGIWFHAIPETKTLKRGSRGCVVVRNETIEHLSSYIDLKRTPMVITNEVEYIEPAKWQELRNTYHKWIEDWRKAWMGKDLEGYLAWYSETFRSNGMNKQKWRAYKKGLADRYKFIDVNLKDVQIFNQGPKIVFRFVQEYKSDQKEDYGTKILYALKTGEKYEIIGESWEPIPNRTVSSSASPASAASANSN